MLLLLAAVVAIIAVSITAGVIDEGHKDSLIEPPSGSVIALPEFPKPPEPPWGAARAVYRHSVIPGGAYSPDEVEQAIRRDHVVAAHYAAIAPHKLRVETLAADRDVYMSYRVADQIYWTKQKVRLRQGETILTDGASYIRARCGNCIAFSAMEPTADDEPAEMEFDALEDAEDIAGSRMPLGSELLRPLFAIPVPWLFSGSAFDPDNSGGGPLAIPLFGLYGDPASELTPLPDLLPGGGEIVFPPALDGDGGIQLPPLTDPLFPQSRPDDPDDPGMPGDPDEPIIPPDFGDPGFDPKTPEDVVPVPEPGTLLLVGGGISALIARKRRSRFRQS